MTIGDEVYSVGLTGHDGMALYRPLRIARVTKGQIVAVDPIGREFRFWRATMLERGMGATRRLQFDRPNERHHKEDIR